MAGLLLEIVTPEGTALKESVDELTAPSIAGEFGILPGHLPVLAAVKTGIIRWKKGAEANACAVGWGFIEVSGDHAYVLTDRYAKREGLDPVRLRADLKDIDEKIDHFKGDPDSSEYQELVNNELWYAAQLELHGDPPPPTVAFVTPYGAAPDEDLGQEAGDEAIKEE